MPAARRRRRRAPDADNPFMGLAKPGVLKERSALWGRALQGNAADDVYASPRKGEAPRECVHHN